MKLSIVAFFIIFLSTIAIGLSKASIVMESEFYLLHEHCILLKYEEIPPLPTFA